MSIWKQKKDGVYRQDGGPKGLPRPYFSDGILPPRRDGDGRPLNPDGTIDMNRWAEEIETGRWKDGVGLVRKK